MKLLNYSVLGLTVVHWCGFPVHAKSGGLRPRDYFNPPFGDDSSSSDEGNKDDQGPGFKCNRPSENEAGNFMEKIIEFNYCLDSDPLPPSILEPSNNNVLLKSSGAEGGIGITYLGAGLYAYGNGGYMGALMVYECTGASLQGTDSCPNVGRKGAILIDAPPALGAGLGSFLKTTLDSLDADLMAMIVTHEHNDHNGGLNAVLESNPTLQTFIASRGTYEKIQVLGQPSYSNSRVQEILTSNPTFPRYPATFDLLIEEEFSQITIGNQTMDTRLVDGHGSGNLLMWHEASGTIINIDPPFEPKWSPFFGLGLGNDVPAMFKLFDIYREYDYELFIAGHSSHVGTPQDIAVAEIYAVDILDAAFAAVVESAADPTSFANFGNIAFNRVNVLQGVNAGSMFTAFREYYAQLNLLCAERVIDPSHNYSGTDWIATLAGVRATIFSHCSVIMFALLTDAPGTIVQ